MAEPESTSQNSQVRDKLRINLIPSAVDGCTFTCWKQGGRTYIEFMYTVVMNPSLRFITKATVGK
jgi:hypothetical protein